MSNQLTESEINELFSLTIPGNETSAFSDGLRDKMQGNAKPNPFDPFTEANKFAAYAQGWMSA